MKYTISLLVFVFGLVSIGYSQEEEHSEGHEPKNLITLGFGYTYIPKATEIGGTEANGVYVPSIGVDYFYRINSKWEIGTMMELELSDYLVLEKELGREKAFVIAALGSYFITPNINIFAGGGVELERNQNLAIFRLGTEYKWHLKNEWLIAPGAFYDIKESFDTWSVVIAFGKEF